jgi:very-short-patch-repair endonuclease
VASAAAVIGEPAVRWRLRTGRWQRPCRAVLVTHSGPISDEEWLWIAVTAAGPEAVLAGITAARLGGLSGFDWPGIHLLLPASGRLRTSVPGTIVHRSRSLEAQDVHPARRPPRTRLARSLLDAAAWARSDDLARAILAAGVQQRLLRADHLSTVLARLPNIRRHALMVSTLADIAAGAQALSELDFSRLIRRYGLPEPDRQVMRRDPAGRRRWLDAYWDAARLVVEVDGLWHMDATAWWADMRRDNELTLTGHRLLRFPAFAVRDQPDAVAAQIRAALSAP